MVEIVTQAFNKTYVFPLFSFTFFMRVALLILTVVAPFFIVYKTGNFYQNSKTQYIDISKVNLKPTYQYYISMKTSSQSYVFTNFFINQANQGLSIKFSQREGDCLNVEIEYGKELAQKVKQMKVYLGFQYKNYNQTSSGLINANIQGYDLAEGAAVGFIQFKDGTGKSAISKSADVFGRSRYDFLSVYEQFYKSSSYMSYRYNSVPISLPSDLFRFNVAVNYPAVKVQQKTPSIFGQLIWSWVQYFPILFVFYLATDYIWLFLLRQGIVKRIIKHDKDYLQILRKQQDRRNLLSNDSAA